MFFKVCGVWVGGGRRGLNGPGFWWLQICVNTMWLQKKVSIVALPTETLVLGDKKLLDQPIQSGADVRRSCPQRENESQSS